MEEYSLIEEDIINKDYLENIRDMVTCVICLNIVEEPLQCEICKHSFCSECIEKFGKCPMGCEIYKFVPSQFCLELLSGIKIKCECGNEINYKDIKKHMEEECKKIDYKEKYFKLKNEYKKLKEEIDNPKQNNEILKNGGIKSYMHKHIIHIMRHFNDSWICDACDTSFNPDIPSYNCTLCDYDICYNCIKDRITLGNIHPEMKKYY